MNQSSGVGNSSSNSNNHMNDLRKAFQDGLSKTRPTLLAGVFKPKEASGNGIALPGSGQDSISALTSMFNISQPDVVDTKI